LYSDQCTLKEVKSILINSASFYTEKFSIIPLNLVDKFRRKKLK